MKRRWFATLGLPLVVALGACDGEPPPEEDSRMDIPGAPGTITEEVDRPPEPELRRDTLPGAPADTGTDTDTDAGTGTNAGTGTP